MVKYVFILMLSLIVAGCASDSSGLNDKASLSPLDQGLKLRKLADAGDDGAMLKLFFLLSRHGPDVFASDKETIKQWKPVGNKVTSISWLSKSAQAGNRDARNIACEMSKSNTAPRLIRDFSKWCDT